MKKSIGLATNLSFIFCAAVLASGVNHLVEDASGVSLTGPTVTERLAERLAGDMAPRTDESLVVAVVEIEG